MTKTQHLSNRIRSARKRAKLTQNDLAIAIGVTPGSVHRWERGSAEPTLTHIKAVAKATKTPVAALVA